MTQAPLGAPAVRRVARDDLRPADILLSVGVGRTSEAIRAFDGGRYSHAAIWTGDAIIEATTPHVARHSLEESLARHPRQYVDVYRHGALRSRHDDVVAAAERYVSRRYSYGDLALAGLVMGTTAWLPTAATQEGALLRACELNRYLELVRTREGKLVTCTELVARAYHEGGAPIRVVPKSGERFDRGAVAAVLASVGELWREAAGKRAFGEAEIAWRATQAHLRRQFVELSGISVPGDRLLAVMRALAAMIAGETWGANLVTPHFLETSPDLTLVGRVHPTPSDHGFGSAAAS